MTGPGKLGNFSITLVGKERIAAIREGVDKVVEDVVDDPGRLDLEAAIQRSAFEWSKRLGTVTISPAERLELAATVAKGAGTLLSAAFSVSDVHGLRAETALRHAQEIGNSEAAFFRSVEPERMQAPLSTMDPKKVARAFAGLGGLASIHVERLHDGWFRANVAGTSRGEAVDGTELRVRPDFAPFHIIQDEMEKGGAAELDRYVSVLTKNATGMRDAIDALVDGAEGQSAPPDRDGYVRASDRAYLLDPDSKRHLHALGYALKPLWESSMTQLPENVPFDAPEHAEVKKALEAIHKRSSLGDPGYVPFDKLSPEKKVGNIPALLAAVDGLLSADRAVRRVLDHGIVGPQGVSDEASLLQRHLFHSVKVAQGLAQAHRPFAEVNLVLARAVTDEAALLAAHAAGVRSDDNPKRFERINAAYFTPVEEAGNHFRPGGGGASAAADVALAHAPKVLGAIDGKKVDDAHVAALVNKATAGDLLLILKQDLGRADATAADIAGMAKYVEQDDYFKPKVAAAKNLTVEKPALTDDERRQLAQVLRLANATWKVGQGHQVMARGDNSRGSPTERGSVFNPYDLLIASFVSPAESLFVGPVKDWLILKSAVERREQKAGGAGGP